MAIDTEVKRRSVHGYAGNSATIAPVPDGAALNEGDRRQVAGIYRGITSGAGSNADGHGRELHHGHDRALWWLPVRRANQHYQRHQLRERRR
jgi:hypothetical protein